MLDSLVDDMQLELCTAFNSTRCTATCDKDGMSGESALTTAIPILLAPARPYNNRCGMPQLFPLMASNINMVLNEKERAIAGGPFTSEGIIFWLIVDFWRDILWVMGSSFGKMGSF